MDTTQRKIKKLNKLRAKADKLKTRVTLGKKKIEIKAEIKALKQNVRFLKHYNINKGLEGFKSGLIELRDGVRAFEVNEPSLKASLITRRYTNMDTTNESSDIGFGPMDNDGFRETVEKDNNQSEKPERGMFEMDLPELPESCFNIGLPF